MTYYMGIDGGGSRLRIVIVKANFDTDTFSNAASACNPSSIGWDAAAACIQQDIRNTLRLAEIAAADITAVAIGLAGAAVDHAGDWLRATVAEVLTNALIVPSSDHEIALVGAHGARRGLLLLAGTGSVAFGINDAGEALQVGGWGYLLGDEGSGYWLGLHALKALVNQSDGTLAQTTTLAQRVSEHLNLSTASDVIRWLYHHDAARTSDVARLAQLVLEEAEQGDLHAQHLVNTGADALANLAQTLMRRLNYHGPLAFAGGLLTSDNPLSRGVRQRLRLDDLPLPQYEPVYGAALLAMQTHQAAQSKDDKPHAD